MPLQPTSSDPARRDSLIQAAKDMVPMLRQRAAQTDTERRLLPETEKAFTDAGFFHLIQPKSGGGLELDIPLLLQIGTIIGSGCPSSAWVLCLLAVHNWAMGLWPVEAQREIFDSHGYARIPMVLTPQGTAETAPGGYRLSGHWTYASGIDIATHAAVAALDPEVPAGEPPNVLTFVVPADRIEVVDDWFVLGLRGTGSKAVRCKNVFVPAHMTHAMSRVDPPGAAVNPHPMYAGFPRVPFFTLTGTAPFIGALQLALDAFYERLHSRNPMYLPTDSQTQRVPSQIRLARAQALYDAASALFFEAANAYWNLIIKRAEITLEHCTKYRLQAAQVLHMCTEAVDLLISDAGTGAYFDHSPIQRAFRDIHMAHSHVAMNLDNASENHARVMLGMPPHPPLV